jgi:carboxymethylenebutenolidase
MNPVSREFSMTHTTRRSLLTRAAALPLATVLANPLLAEERAGETQSVAIDTLRNGKRVSGALATPAQPGRRPTVLLVHEWWGLNDQIRTMAVEFAAEGYLALAADLYDGEIGTNREENMRLMNGVDVDAATDTLVSWIEWLRRHEAGNGRVATVGWCFGGGWSLNASLATRVAATVIYYGNVAKSADQLKALAGPVLGHFATRDQYINHDMVCGFEAAMIEAGKTFTDYWYTADHAFANPTGANYDGEDARLAWSRTLAFLGEELATGRKK